MWCCNGTPPRAFRTSVITMACTTTRLAVLPAFSLGFGGSESLTDRGSEIAGLQLFHRVIYPQSYLCEIGHGGAGMHVKVWASHRDMWWTRMAYIWHWDEKIKTVRDAPVPRALKELESFIGDCQLLWFIPERTVYNHGTTQQTMSEKWTMVMVT